MNPSEATQTSAQGSSNAKTIYANIRHELQSQSRSHLMLAKLFLELKNCFNEKENSFYSKVHTKFGLKRRAVEYYVRVAKAEHLHGLRIEWSKLQLLSSLNESEFKALNFKESELKKLSVRRLKSRLAPKTSAADKSGERSEKVSFVTTSSLANCKTVEQQIQDGLRLLSSGIAMLEENSVQLTQENVQTLRGYIQRLASVEAASRYEDRKAA